MTHGRVVATVTVAQFVGVASTTVLTIALPSLGTELPASSSQQQWIINAFLLVLASSMITGGVIADRFGGRPVFVAGMAAFGLGSLICALAPSVGWLLPGRVVQALGPALIVPSSLTVLSRLYGPGPARARAIGTWSLGSGIGLASGPLLGGLIVSALGWRAVFWVNAIAAALILLVALRTIPTTRGARDIGRRIDVGSSLLLAAFLALVVDVLVDGRQRGWSSAPTLALGALAVLVLAAFLRRQARNEHPLVDASLVRNRTALAVNGSGAAVFGALTASSLYLSVFLQQVQGRSPLSAGLCLLPLGAVSAPAGQLAVRLTGRVGPRLLIASGLLFVAAGCVSTATLDAGASAARVVVGSTLLGLGTGLALPVMTMVAVTAAPGALTGIAAALHQTSRQLGQTLAVAVVGTIIYGTAGLGAETPSDPRFAADWVRGLNTAGALMAAVLAVVTAALVVTLRSPPSRSGRSGRTERQTPRQHPRKEEEQCPAIL